MLPPKSGRCTVREPHSARRKVEGVRHAVRNSKRTPWPQNSPIGEPSCPPTCLGWISPLTVAAVGVGVIAGKGGDDGSTALPSLEDDAPRPSHPRPQASQRAIDGGWPLPGKRAAASSLGQLADPFMEPPVVQ